MTNFSQWEYWNQRYQQDPSPFEFYCSYDTLKMYLKDIFQPNLKILHLGSGTSNLPIDLYDDPQIAQHNQTCIDFAPKVTEIMQQRIAERKIKYLTLELSKLQLPPKEYDLIIDKACLDCVFCSEKAEQEVQNCLSQIYEVLADQGHYIMISYANPQMRITWLTQQSLFDVNVIEIPRYKIIEGVSGGDVYYCYDCKKKQKLEIK